MFIQTPRATANNVMLATFAAASGHFYRWIFSTRGGEKGLPMADSLLDFTNQGPAVISGGRWS
jgi:hypothetical protein